MNPKHRPSLSPSPSASPLKGKGNDNKTTNELAEYGIHDVELTEDDLTALVEELGLGEADASDLVKGLSGFDSKTTPTIKVEAADKKADEEKADAKVAEGTAVDQKEVDGNTAEEKVEKVEIQKAVNTTPISNLDTASTIDTASEAKDNTEVTGGKNDDTAEREKTLDKKAE